MQDLINRITQKAGITAEQAASAIDTIKDFVKEKFPMMGGAVDNLLASNSSTSGSPAGSNIMDKISDVIPGETGQKVEDFAKNAAEKAEDLFDSAKDKLSGLFGGDKK